MTFWVWYLQLKDLFWRLRSHLEWSRFLLSLIRSRSALTERHFPQIFAHLVSVNSFSELSTMLPKSFYSGNMSERKVTPRHMVHDFLSEAPEQSAQRPSRKATTRSRNMSGPSGPTRSTASKKSERQLAKERKSMHLSLLDDKTPRGMVRLSLDFTLNYRSVNIFTHNKFVIKCYCRRCACSVYI